MSLKLNSYVIRVSFGHIQFRDLKQRYNVCGTDFHVYIVKHYFRIYPTGGMTY